MEQETVKTCKCCGRTLDISNFKKCRWGYVSVCMDCDKQHREENRQVRKQERLDKARREIENVRDKRLADFTPRELMTELKRRGYEGKLTYVETHTIDLSTL